MTCSSLELNENWLAVNVAKVTEPGTVISDPSYSLDGWMQARVPGTVLTTLIENGIYDDPYYGTNSESIPDISATGIETYTYWFAAPVDVPPLQADQQVWLRFRGINYTARIFFNGQQLTPAPVAGMFLRQTFNVTAYVDAGSSNNRVAVLVTPPDPCGTPGGNGGKSNEPNIALNVTQRYSVGWDWVLPIADRNTGIWDRVSLEVTGPVRMDNPHIVTSVGDNVASVATTVELTNASSTSQICSVSCSLDGQITTTEVRLAPNVSGQLVTLDALFLENPRLWWPSGYGEQPLYEVTFTVWVDGVSSASVTRKIGLREITVNTLTMSNGTTSRQFCVNGQPIFLRGGNWIGTDAMLRHSTKRYDDELRMLALSNLNFVRVWGGGIAERPGFYEACDRLGLLVMQDFWMSGEYSGVYPEGYAPIFLACAEDTIKFLRNHPSLLFWCGGNESTPPDPIPATLQQWIEGPSDTVLDGTRPYITMSTNISGSNDNQYLDGPYGILDPPEFYEAPGQDSLRNTPFNPELGSVGTPLQESILRSMPAADANQFPLGKTIGADWKLHCYISYVADTGVDQIALYGTPTTLEQFAFYAQLANYIQYRALIEGYTQQMWSEATGFAIWKVQNPWPGLRGSFYDWYLDPNGALYGARSAAEPIHIQLDLLTFAINIVNVSATSLTDVSWAGMIIDVDGNRSGNVSGTAAAVPAMQVTPTGTTMTMPSELDVWFVLLTLESSNGSSTNLYWLHSAGGDYTGLAALPAPLLDLTATMQANGDRYVIELVAHNLAASVAFFLHLQLREADGTTRILPVFYTDNFFSIAGNAGTVIGIDVAKTDVHQSGEPQLWIEGFNLSSMQIPMKIVT